MNETAESRVSMRLGLNRCGCQRGVESIPNNGDLQLLLLTDNQLHLGCSKQFFSRKPVKCAQNALVLATLQQWRFYVYVIHNHALLLSIPAVGFQGTQSQEMAQGRGLAARCIVCLIAFSSVMEALGCNTISYSEWSVRSSQDAAGMQRAAHVCSAAMLQSCCKALVSCT